MGGGVRHFFELEAMTRRGVLSCDPECLLVDDFKLGRTVMGIMPGFPLPVPSSYLPLSVIVPD